LPRPGGDRPARPRGDQVSAVFLEGSAAFELPPAVRVRRVGADLSYRELLDLIFASDHVITW